jgi:hypothetical protein
MSQRLQELLTMRHLHRNAGVAEVVETSLNQLYSVENHYEISYDLIPLKKRTSIMEDTRHVCEAIVNSEQQFPKTTARLSSNNFH